MNNTINLDIRTTILRMINAGNGSHIASALSCVEILNAVYTSTNVKKILNQDEDRDRVVLSKGHGTSALYAVMYHHGLLSLEAIKSYCQNGSILAGHTTHFVENVEHSTGALGHGLPVGLGMAIGSQSKGLNNRIFVVVGDGELHEGSNWEAIMYAGHKKMGNLCLLIDKNEMAQMGSTDEACSINPLLAKFEAFNFNAYELDGHDELAIINAINSTQKSDKPVALICNTIKGKGISFMENDNLWHYRTPKGEDFEKAIQILSNK